MTWEVERRERGGGGCLPPGADKHLAPSAAQWQRLKAVDARHRIRASLDDFFPPVVTELVLRIDPLSESLLGCSDKNGFRVDLIDRNRAREAVSELTCRICVTTEQRSSGSREVGAPFPERYLWASVKTFGLQCSFALGV